MLSGKSSAFESEIGRLRAENQTLGEELTQCQADKEFVWSLWKRLQVANPDITQAVGMVVQREKEKMELKDRKVLEILQHKDTRIEELSHTASSQTQQLTLLMSKNVELERKVGKLDEENMDLLDIRARLHGKLAEMEKERDETASRQAVRDLDRENLELKQQLAKKDTELARLEQDKEDLSSIRSSQADRIEKVEEDLKVVGENYEKLAREHTDAKNLLKKYENELTSLKSDLNRKDKDLQAARKEAEDLWKSHSQAADDNNQQAGLIRQLHNINKDTQLMMKNQEEAFKLESNSLRTQNDALLEKVTDLKHSVRDYKQRVMEQDKVINDLEDQLHRPGLDDPQPPDATTDRIYKLQTEIDELREHMSNRRGRSRTRSQASSPIRFASSLGYSDAATSPLTSDPSPRSRRSRSETRELIPHQENDVRILSRKLDTMQRKLDEGHNLLHKKNRELEEIKRAHDKRLERLQSLAANHKLVKKQLKLTEEEVNVRMKKKRLTRSHPKSLQKEDSDKVWNELNYYREEAKNLSTENMNLHEEVDRLRVRVASDAATVHELRVCLEQEKEELRELLAERENGVSKEEHIADLDTATRQIQVLETKFLTVQREMKEVGIDKDRLLEERRDMKQELHRLEKRDADHRIHTADLRREVNRLQRELKRRKASKPTKSHVAKQYQKSLNQSIQRMGALLEDVNKDGWEDVVTQSDTEGDVTVTELTGTSAGTAESLGTAIATRAIGEGGICDESGSYTLPVHTSTPSPRRTRPRTRQNVGDNKYTAERTDRPTAVTTRDKASSPVHFVSPSSDLDLVPARETVYSDRGVSPVRFPSPRVKSTAPSGGKLVATLKQRIHSLQQQVHLLKQAKETAVKSQMELKTQAEHQQTELTTVSQRLHTQKMACQHLGADVERLKSEKEDLEKQLERAVSEESHHSEHEWSSLHSRLKSATAEVSRQLTTIKQLREENSSQTEKVIKLQDRVNHLERDLGQKRTLLEDMKIKWRLAQDNAQSDADIMLEVENKLKSLNDTNTRYKAQIDSFRQRIAAVIKERHDCEEKVSSVSHELDKKNKQVSDLQRKNTELKVTVDEMERTAEEQLHQLANQSEAAIDTAQSRLNQANNLIQEFHKFINVLSHSLLNSIQQLRSLIKSNRQRQSSSRDSSAMQRAQSTACDILNLSQSDLDDLLSVSEAQSSKKSTNSAASDKQEVKLDRKWIKKWEKLLQSEEFAIPLAELFLEKIEDKFRLVDELKMC